MGLGPNERYRVRLILQKDGTALTPRTLAALTGYPMKDIRDFLRNERKKERRRLGGEPKRPRNPEYHQRRRVREKAERVPQIIARELADCPPDRDPIEHERIVRMVFADMC